MTERSQKVVRFAPSPTGFFHIGSARTALFNFLFAKKNNAKIVLRFEDTDVARSKKEFEENILEGMDWLGITYDEIYRQSERTDIYRKYVNELLDSGQAYISEEKGGERSSVIRFRNPNTTVTFVDKVRGEVSFDTTELGDFVIAKSETEPLYHFAVVVDDALMGVTDVIRGEDHISNTPRQILILEAIGAERPRYAHIPMILAPDRSKLSKRHGAVSVTEYRDQGFLPGAILNYLSLLGWNPGGEQEIFSLEELINLFSLERVQKSGAIFSIEKLRWFNSEHIKRLTSEERSGLLVSFLRTHEVSSSFLELLVESQVMRDSLLERVETLGDVLELIKAGEYDYFIKNPSVEKSLVLKKGVKEIDAKRHLEKTIELLERVDDFSDPENIKSAVWDYATEEGRGDVLWPMRVSLSGKERSVDPFTISVVLGKLETIRRLKEVAKEL